MYERRRSLEKRYQNIKVIFTGFNEQNEIIFLTHDDIDISKVPSIENIFIIQKFIMYRI